MTTNVYLDARAVKEGKPAPVKIAIRQKGQVSYINLGISVLPSQWNAARRIVVKHPNASNINIVIAQKMTAVEKAALALMEDGTLSGLNSQQLRDRLLLAVDPEAKRADEDSRLFRSRFVRHMEHAEADGTKRVYAFTLRKLEAFDPKLASRRFEDLTRDYIQDFEQFCARTEKKNSRNIHLRNIRTVFNEAIDAEITTAYPFRKLPIRPEKTRKKALTAEQLRALATIPCEPCQEQYRDMFMLMFMLRGVNACDLFSALPSALKDGRFEYRRSKVGTLFSVKVEPEAMSIIDRYRGKAHLLNPLDSYADYHDYLHHLNNALKGIGRDTGKRGKVLGPGLFPELSSNWARHSWATAASKIDIPKEVISRGLGHSFGLAVTDIYIDFDESKVDDANRKIIDYVLYGKDWRKNTEKY